jgi:hypothetical protein
MLKSCLKLDGWSEILKRDHEFARRMKEKTFTEEVKMNK